MISWIVSHYFYLLMFLIGVSIVTGLAKPAIDLLVKLACFSIRGLKSVFTSIKEEIAK